MSFPGRHSSARQRIRIALRVLLLAPLSLLAAAAQLSVTGTGSSSSQPTVSIAGVVLNASNNQPISRALVQLGSQAILTTHDGKFEFSADAGSSSVIHVGKPGFYETLDPNPTGRRINVASTPPTPVTLYLYPEGLITGTVTAPSGDPLSGISVQALRRYVNEFAPTWIVSHQTSTDSGGQFRLPLSPGDYVIETGYRSDRTAVKQAILPLLVPGSQPGASSVIHLASGSEQHLDLQPPVRPTHEVHLQIDGAPERGFPQLEAHLLDGLSFFPVSRQSGSPGELTTTLPTGTYTLTMTRGDGEEISYGETSVTVGDKDVSGVVLHLVRALPLPVELIVDPASQSTSQSGSQSGNPTPSVQQLGLSFIRQEQGPNTSNQTVYLRSGRGETPSFSLVPGRYKLQARSNGGWFVESATVAGTDLLTQDFDVEPGGAATPLRIVVSDQTASVKGSVKIDGSPGPGCWVYLYATSPAITPSYLAVSGTDGSFTRPTVPPGSYRAIAFETHHTVDFGDQATLDRLAPYFKTITVAAGEVGTVDMDVVPAAELNR